MPGLEAFFEPDAVALVGASDRDGLLGRPLRYLTEFGYAGTVYPVNPRYTEMRGLPCFRSVTALPGPVDLAVLQIPAAKVVDTVAECGEAGIRAVIVLASGFAEIGHEGRRLQDRLQQAARSAGVRVLGPNCQGILYAPRRLAATFTAGADGGFAPSTGLAYVGQSGAIGGSVLDLARERRQPLAAWVSTGNQVDVDLVEAASHLLHDDRVDVCMCYLEEVGDGPGCEALARLAAELDKRLVVLRAGSSEAGRRAVASHTGAMVRPSMAFELVSRRWGAVVVDDVDELLDTAIALRGRRSLGPSFYGRGRVGVVTTSGGAGILLTDHCARQGLGVPDLGDGTRVRLAPLVPEFGSVANPVDVTAQLFNRNDQGFGDICEIVAADQDVDVVGAVVTMVTGEAADRLAADLTSTAARLAKPLAVAWLASEEQTRNPKAILRAGGLNVFGSVGALARSIRRLAEAGPQPTPVSPTAERPGPARFDRGKLLGLLGREVVTEADGVAFLDELGVRHPRSLVARNADEAAAAAESLGGPLALKVSSPDVLHKTDVGGVRLDVAAADAGRVYGELVAAAGRAAAGRRAGGPVSTILVQAMAPAGTELIVGVTAEDGFPPVLTVGIGGTAAELYGDVASALAPVDPEEARAMLRRLRGWPLLAGHRGRPPRDVEAAVAVIVAVGEAAAVLADDLLELEINPLIAGPAGEGAMAVDLLVRTIRT
ncbi:MAG: CoA-binding protein [Streptosporangiales bacterium]|nr:CoA-binding protein [Streptosporangiales bacterium]